MKNMKSLKNRPIGIFDSGVGGLTVVKSVQKYLPREDIIYFGDTARVPYGNKSRSTVTRFSREIMDFMIKKRVKMVIVACNTASSFSLGALRKHYNIPVIGVISPGAREAVSLSLKKRIGVIGTNSTISSRAYEKEAAKTDPNAKLFSNACPLFVPLVENGFLSDPITLEVAKIYLKAFKAKNIDALILGCTHYPLLKKVIGKVMKDVELVDSSSSVAKEAKCVLLKKDLNSSRASRRGSLKCYVSDEAETFRRTAGLFLKKKIQVKKVALCPAVQ